MPPVAGMIAEVPGDEFHARVQGSEVRVQEGKAFLPGLESRIQEIVYSGQGTVDSG